MQASPGASLREGRDHVEGESVGSIRYAALDVHGIRSFFSSTHYSLSTIHFFCFERT